MLTERDVISENASSSFLSIIFPAKSGSYKITEL